MEEHGERVGEREGRGGFHTVQFIRPHAQHAARAAAGMGEPASQAGSGGVQVTCSVAVMLGEGDSTSSCYLFQSNMNHTLAYEPRQTQKAEGEG